MRAVWDIARLVLLEGLRNRLHHGILAFAALMLLAAVALASVTMGRTEMLVLDLGLGVLALFLQLVAVVFTIQIVQQEKENRTLYLLLTRLAQRWPYMLGKSLGVGGVLAVQAAGMGVLLFLLARFFGVFDALSYVQAVAATFLEAWIVAATALVFAQSSSFFLAVLFTIGVDVAGHFHSIIAHLGARAELALARWLAKLATWALPDLESVSVRDLAGIAPLAAADWWQLMAYAGLTVAAWTALAIAIFSRRNLA